MKNVLALLALLLLCVNGWGCAQSPPEHFSIDPDFSEQERAVILDVLASWCDAAGYCPTEATWSERGRFELVDKLSQKGMGKCPEGTTCVVPARNRNDNVLVARVRPSTEDLDLFWTEMAHEVGHYCTEHTASGLMKDYHEQGEPLVVDAVAVAAWHDGCP
jgi:hypothetical protein